VMAMSMGAIVGCFEPATHVATSWPSPERLDPGTRPDQ
jgi:hypothetical protein